jgi:uncharacterized protein YbjT (DUF2867 family)
MILVTGATGNVGSELVRALLAAGEPVRALIRRETDQARLPDGAQGVVGDLNHPATMATALTGVQAIYLLAGYDGLPDLLAAARAVGVERAVLQSGSSAPSGDLTNAVTRYQVLAEQAIRESGLDWTFLQPGAFMSNTLRWAPQLRAGDTIRAPFAGVRQAVIDPFDIAAVAAAALTTDGHGGRSYRLSGPEALLPADRVAILARVLGRDLRFEAQPDEEARAEMTASMPTEYVDAFFRFYVDGTLDESEVLPTVEEITGRPPRSFEQWARAHADALR